MQNEEETPDSVEVFWWEFVIAAITVAVGIIVAVLMGVSFVNFIFKLLLDW